MLRHVQALDDLNNKTGICAAHLTQIKGGINSSVLKLICTSNKSYALKLYADQTPEDKRNRRKTEALFLEFLHMQGIYNAPKLIFTSPTLNYSLLSWIEGTKPSKLSELDIKKIVNFIAKINTKVGASPRLPWASDALKNLESLKVSISRRMHEMAKVQANTPLEEEVHKWIKSILIPYTKNELLGLESRLNKSAWSKKEMINFISPSDVGIHNLIYSKQSLFFIDFEYAGKDDLSKFITDWILQPNYPLSSEQEMLLINELCSALPEQGQSWIERYSMTKKLNISKWLFIMLRGYKEYRLTPQDWEKVKRYAILNNLT